ncbi:hypothetical protein SERLADRAFT_437680 [Serpula lacrymans var. lacrymans S7.9]|uniref:Uncharacterized protein n=1 Tax=Serpula lacrymans var. lacrymans (strain S7.9) TaxID=578457 RepID=F8NV00_SERL9|nr:uncharacterized protein SERLADRAFT_437680 [Serpula lacrymans var. lacrymans S7.9]EGO25955.1 hypothetical protein SERLADRAFT_437680 [Serpula lacrymans var. lacrymans S7.9]
MPKPTGVILLDNEQAALVQQTEKLLSDEQLRAILSRRELECSAQPSETETNLNSPVAAKGKGPDPRNWGGLDLEQADLEPDAQREALLAWNEAQDWVKQDYPPQAGPSGAGRECEPERGELDPLSGEDNSPWRTSRQRSKREDPRKTGYDDPITAHVDTALKPMRDYHTQERGQHVLAPANQVDLTSYIGHTLGRFGG